MEQNVDTSAPMTPVVENKQNGENGLKVATAIACIVAVCGIGFGIYGMMQSSQKDSQISDLKVQIKEADGTVTTIETPEIETNANDGTTITITDTVIDEYKNFADNLANNYEAHLFSYDGEDSVSIEVENSHLTISNFNVDGRGGESVFAESDNIISVYLVEVGNGSVPYVYMIKKDGSVARIDISKNGARTIENLDGYEKIVSIFGDGDLYAHLIDIDGNVYKNS